VKNSLAAARDAFISPLVLITSFGIVIASNSSRIFKYKSTVRFFAGCFFPSSILCRAIISRQTHSMIRHGVPSFSATSMTR
jgi:hypothetical protein